MRQVLVTGASGFIGSALCRRLLRDGASVTAFVRDEDPPIGCRIIRGDLTDGATVRRAMLSQGWDVVYHLGAQALVGVGQRDPLTTLNANVAGTWNVLEGLRAMGDPSKTALVVASSDKAYGHLPSRTEYHENDPLEGRGIYDCSKSCADLLAQAYAEDFGLPIVIARLGNVYGPGDPEPTRIVPSIVDGLVNIRRPRITSDGSPVRDYLYIDDAVSAYVALGRPVKHPGRAYNFSGGRPVSVLELVRIATEQALRSDPEGEIWAGYKCLSHELRWKKAPPESHLVNVQRPREELEPEVLGIRGRGEIEFQALSCSRAKEELGWSPRTTLEDGLRKTLGHAWSKKVRAD